MKQRYQIKITTPDGEPRDYEERTKGECILKLISYISCVSGDVVKIEDTVTKRIYY